MKYPMYNNFNTKLLINQVVSGKICRDFLQERGVCMEQRDFKICLISGLVAICMLAGLVLSAFTISNNMIENANEQLQETRQLALDSYRMAVDKYYGVVDTNNPNDDTIQLQNPTNPDATEPADTDPVETEPIETKPVSDSTEDGKPSTGDGDDVDDKDTTVDDDTKDDSNDDSKIDDTVDLVVIPGTDPKPENTGWDEDATFVEHKVVYGDTLSMIADMYGVDMYDIAEFNGLEGVNYIYEGQILIIPLVDNWNEI